MYTPQEVSEKTFPKSTGLTSGYNMTAVDEFLDGLTEDYTALYKDNTTLKAKLKMLAEKVEEYRATEDAMRSTLLAAQKMAAQMVADAQAEKEKTIADAQAQVAMAMNTQMKIFYRPDGLTPTLPEAMKKVSFSLKKQNNQYVVTVHNPTPYHVSFGQIQLHDKNRSYLVAQEMDMMVVPFADRQYQFEHPPTSLSGNMALDYIYFNDAGNEVKNSQLLKVTP